MINVLVCSTDVECSLKFISLSRHVEETECEMHRKSSIIGKHLVNYGVKTIYNFNNDLNFKIDENGKPYLEGCDIQFNISHSDSCVVAAFDKKPVGVDVENSNREIKNVNSLAKRIFTESERSLKTLYFLHKYLFKITGELHTEACKNELSHRT